LGAAGGWLRRGAAYGGFCGHVAGGEPKWSSSSGSSAACNPTGWIDAPLRTEESHLSFGRLKSLLADERGQGLAEYAVIAGIFAVIALFGLRTLAAATNASLRSSANKIGD
jgi:Flp pilus assembly pilin Flp